MVDTETDVWILVLVASDRVYTSKKKSSHNPEPFVPAMAYHHALHWWSKDILICIWASPFLSGGVLHHSVRFFLYFLGSIYLVLLLIHDDDDDDDQVLKDGRGIPLD